jgi:DNA invertase Pin-like site-specific DNA recombinase
LILREVKSVKVYGYARVSTLKQNIERQIRNIKDQYPEAIMVTDEYTGTNMSRPGWQKIYKAAKAGDVIVFDSVSRMSRDAEEGFQVYEELFLRGVELIFLKERHIDTATYKQAIDGQLQITVNTGDGKTDELISGISAAINKYLLSLAKEQIRLAFDQAEKEVEDLQQRTREGIETARLNGKQIGRAKGDKLVTKKSVASKEIILKRSKDFNGDLTDAEMLKLTGLSRNTFYKYKKALKEGQ